VSNVSAAELSRARKAAEIASVQNSYNLGDRSSDALIDICAGSGIAFIPFYPLAKGRLARPDSPLARIAERQHATPGQIALAWLLHRSPAMLPIPGTSSIAHFEENLGSASIRHPGGGSTGYALLNLVYASGSASRSANAYLAQPTQQHISGWPQLQKRLANP
jgi:aryl-alcohol dehydrogenase-like predicted oxidoreductase